MQKQNARLSGPQLLKLLAMFLILISHVVQTLCSKYGYYENTDYIIDLGKATESGQHLVLAIMRQVGVIGSWTFFIITAWFLAGSKKSYKEKALRMLVEVWTISIVWLIVFKVTGGGELPAKVTVRQFLPFTYWNNWFASCYILFLLVCPLLNRLIEGLGRRTHFRIAVVMGFLWGGLDFLIEEHFAWSYLTLWISMYLIITYMKKYCTGFCDSLKANLTLLILGAVLFVGLILLTNFLGLHTKHFAKMLLRWNRDSNVFAAMIAIGAVNLFRRMKFRNRGIDYLAGLTLFIYLFHENFLFRSYYRPAIWHWLYETYGYSHVVLLALAYSALLFLAAVLVSILYKETIHRLLVPAAKKLYSLLAKCWRRIEDRCIGQSDRG